MRLLFFNTHACRHDGPAFRATTGEEDEVARLKEFLVPVPGRDLGEGVGPDHEEELRGRLGALEVHDGQERVGFSAAPDLKV
ncbi:MAG: hypothetical protein HW377_773 [Actinobacteria bacterium]|nr:hypothetical protein [Actinomycetota bacterium]